MKFYYFLVFSLLSAPLFLLGCGDDSYSEASYSEEDIYEGIIEGSLPTNPDDPWLLAYIHGCDTSLDISNGLGEVTNAYINVGNGGNNSATDVLLTLSANDEHEEHPDKYVLIDVIPSMEVVRVKMTVDTDSEIDTQLFFTAESREGATLVAEEPDCSDIDTDLLFNTLDIIDLIPSRR